MLKELKRVGERLDVLLATEKLPAQICPEYLMQGVTSYPKRGGKRLRPALTFWFCGLVGGNPDRAARTALGIELYHNWTLIHDDIIDDDDLRRGQPTCHIQMQDAGQRLGLKNGEDRVFGRNMAILAGDILHGWAINLISRAYQDGVPLNVVNSLMRRLTGWVTPELIGGEALDVEFETRHEMNADEIENMLLMKTGVLLQFAAEAGVMIGRNVDDIGDPMVKNAAVFAARAGMAFQLQDDILGTFGDEDQLGKPVCSDLREGKHTLLLATARKLCTPAHLQELTGLVGNATLTDTDAERCRTIMIDCGALASVQQRAAGLVREAHEVLDKFPDNQYRGLLRQWVDFLVSRNH